MSGSVLDPGTELHQTKPQLQGPLLWLGETARTYTTAILVTLDIRSLENAVHMLATGPVHILFLLGAFAPTQP